MQVGTDIIEIERVHQVMKRQPKFARRVLSDAEYDLFKGMSERRGIEFVAGRFCAKEAYTKALGVGIGKIAMKDIAILPNAQSAPYIASGPVVDDVAISISHSQAYATAVAIINVSQEVVQESIQTYLSRNK